MDNEHTPDTSSRKEGTAASHKQLNHLLGKRFLRERLPDDARLADHQSGAVAVSMVLLASIVTTLLVVYVAADRLTYILHLFTR